MAISFNQIPVTLRTPGQYVEFDNSRALNGLLGIDQRLLILGQSFPTGATPAGELVMVGSASDAEKKFGRGSMLWRMIKAAKAVNSYTEMWAVGLFDSASSAKATGSLTLDLADGFTEVSAGTLFLYVGGERIKQLVLAKETPAAIAANLVATINANTALPVTASAVDGVVTLTARHAGLCANDLDLRLNYYRSDALPKGLDATLAAMSGGTDNPDVTDALAALADEQFNYIVCPWTDPANLTIVDDELEDRWGPMRQIEGVAFTTCKGTLAEMSTIGNTRNEKLCSLMGAGLSPTDPTVWAAVYGATAAYYLNIDPARPLQTLALDGVLAPLYDQRLSREERNILLHDGVSTYWVDSDGQCRLERAITTYRVNEYDVEDPSYLDINTLCTLAYVRYQVRARISNRYGRHKLAKDGTVIKGGQAIVTPSAIRAELIGLFREMQDVGIVEDLDQFKEELVVNINESDPNRVDVLMSPNLINQLRVFAGQIQFIL